MAVGLSVGEAVALGTEVSVGAGFRVLVTVAVSVRVGVPVTVDVSVTVGVLLGSFPATGKYSRCSIDVMPSTANTRNSTKANKRTL